jgi:hypothetical protein
MKRITLLLLLSVLAILLYARAKQNSQAKPLVFTHVTVIDATGAPAKPDMTVVITGDRITALGQTGKVRVPKEAQVIDATGQFLIPGLWDMHVHTLRPERIGIFFPLFIANGVTGVRDTHTPAPLEQVQEWRKQIAEGKLLGPRFVAAGPLVDGPNQVVLGSLLVATEAEGRQAVDSLKKEGADFVKLHALVPREAYFAIADEARRQGIPFAGHVPFGVTAVEASDAGQRSIEHLSGVSLTCSTNEAELRQEVIEATLKAADFATFSQARRRVFAKARATYSEQKCAALFARFARNRTWHVPTFTLGRFQPEPRFLDHPRLKYLPASVVERWKSDVRARTPEEVAAAKRNFQRKLKLVSEMRGAGVPFLAGTDTAIRDTWLSFPGFSLHDELAFFVKAGFMPMEALQTATRNPAKFLGELDEMGTVEEGKVADLVLLDANPLEDIRNTQKIRTVVLNGRYLDRAALDRMLAEVEAAATNE